MPRLPVTMKTERSIRHFRETEKRIPMFMAMLMLRKKSSLTGRKNRHRRSFAKRQLCKFDVRYIRNPTKFGRFGGQQFRSGTVVWIRQRNSSNRNFRRQRLCLCRRSSIRRQNHRRRKNTKHNSKNRIFNSLSAVRRFRNVQRFSRRAILNDGGVRLR